MSQQPTPQNPSVSPQAADAAPSQPQQPQQTQPQQPQQPIAEEVIFDGSPTWLGCMRSFVRSLILALVLLIVPIVLMVYEVAVPWWVTAGAVVLAMLLVLLQYGYHRTIRFRITNYRIDF